MKKILTSLGIIGLVGAMAIGATMSYLSDTETSAGNVFTAGAIDLTVDNESYYNGEVSVGTTFDARDLDDGVLFINFTDLKPDDEGEDTISLHVNNNDAYLCMDMSLTSDDDISSNEPELKVDVEEDPDDFWDGELADLIQMIWWADDGDNVLEDDEMLLNGGVQTITDLFGDNRIFTADLADSTTNVWAENPGPVTGSETYYIGKGWCFGTMTLEPVTPGEYDSPIGSQGSGFTCDGKGLGNESQTDSLTMNIAFRAMQARHNENYTCDEEDENLATLTVNKVVVNDSGGNETADSFQLKVIRTSTNVTTNVTSGNATTFATGDYRVTEDGITGYQASWTGDCDEHGNVTLEAGDNKTCTITNDDLPANIQLTKVVDGGNLNPSNFSLFVDGTIPVPSGASAAVEANVPHTIGETLMSDYDFDSITGDAKCPINFTDTVTLTVGESLHCIITNVYNE